jgi:transcriptional regulator GlxA family with amidase domain
VAARTIGILVFDDVEELDAVGPWEVLAFWAQHWPDDGWQATTIAVGDTEVRCAKGLRLRADKTVGEATDLDVLVHPGGHGTRRLMRDEKHLGWIRDTRARTPLLTSVCTGSLVYAAAGLLRNRPATTHWASLDLLKETDGTIDLRPDDRYVDDGDIVTSAGVSAGIDLALHLVARLQSKERAVQVRRGIQYDPQPPV